MTHKQWMRQAGYMTRPRPMGRLSTKGWATLVLWCLGLTALALALAGCGTPGYIKAEAIQGTLERVVDRHNTYTIEDESLSDLEKRVNLRDADLLLKLVYEAQEPTEEEEDE